MRSNVYGAHAASRDRAPCADTHPLYGAAQADISVRTDSSCSRVGAYLRYIASKYINARRASVTGSKNSIGRFFV